MPIPLPKPGESKDEFISRCMEDSVMIDEYDSDQRYAICNSQWEEGKNKEVSNMRKDVLYVAKGLDMSSLSPSDEHLEMINKFTRTEKAAHEVYAFPTYALNDQLDRDLDRFTAKAIRGMFKMPTELGPIGKPFMYLPSKGAINHSGATVKGRIYHGEAKREAGTTWAKLWVYMANTDQNRDFIENIDFGVLWAVSVGLGVKSMECSICGDPFITPFFCKNEHWKGDKYNGQLCTSEVNEIGEFFELTQCYLGSQYNASIASASKSFYNIGYGMSMALDDEIDKTVVAYKNFPLADESAQWSFSHDDVGALLGPSGNNWARLKSIHAIFDGDGTPKEKEAYHFPHHKVIDGSIKTVWQGVSAAGAEIMGAGDGHQNENIEGAKDHLAKHYEQFNKTPPWKNEKVMNLVDLSYDIGYNEEDGALVIYTYDDDSDVEKVWSYDGDAVKEIVTTKEVKGQLDKDKAKTEGFSQEEVTKMFEEKDKALEDKEKIISWLTAEKEHLAPLAKAGSSYVESLKQKCLKSYVMLNKVPGDDNEPDITFMEKLIANCGSNVELLEMLNKDYTTRVDEKFPQKDRRSTEEEPIPDDSKKGKKAKTNKKVDELHRGHEE